MKALVLEEYKKFAYTDFPDPEISEEEVLIKVKACGICGSDVHGMDGSTGRRIPPVIMGHEASGVIAGVGEKVVGWEKGDRVCFDSTIYKLDDWYTRKGMYNLSEGRMVMGVSAKEFKRHGAFAEYLAVPQHILYRLPDEVSFTQAAMVEPVAVAMHAVSLTPLQMNDSAVVFGAGMIGLFVIQILKVAGCKNIVAVDLEQDRLDMALKLGATHAFHPEQADLNSALLKLTENRGADIAFEVVGISQTVNMAVNSLRKGGTLTLVGNLSPSVEIPLQAVVTRQLRLQGACAINGEYPAVLDMIASGQVIVDALLSAEAPLSEGGEWFHRLYNKEKGLIKVVLVP